MFRNRKIDDEKKNEKNLEKDFSNMEKTVDDNSVIGIWENFTQTTGFHGVNKITFSKNSPRKMIRSICWISVWLACAVYLTYTVTTELKSYYSYPTISNTYINFHHSLNFPAVTICNLSPMKRSAFSADDKTTNLFMTTSGMYSFSQPINWSDPFYENEGYFKEQTIEDIFDQSKGILDFLYGAVFDHKQYLYNDVLDLFKPVYTDMGLCLRANSDGKMTTAMHGALFNMQLYINVMTYEDYFSDSLSSGIQIAIHDINVEPIMMNEAIVIRPASEAFIEIQQKKHTFLPPPYKAFGNQTCLQKSGYSYSKCYQDCWEAIISEKCGCRSFLSKDNGSYCSYYKYLTCSNLKFWELMTTDTGDTCNCPTECQYTTYAYSFSTGSYPSGFVVSQLAAKLGWPSAFIRENFALVRIYYKSLTTMVTEQVPKYENAGDIFANLGGQLGLFLGASILTVTELLELIVFLIYTIIHRYANRQGHMRTELTEKGQTKCTKILSISEAM